MTTKANINAAIHLLQSSNSTLRGSFQPLTEELTPSHQKKADKMTDYYSQANDRQLVLNHATKGTYEKFQYDQDTGRKVIRIPIKLNQDKVDPSHMVKNFLQDKGYHIKDTESYRQGLAHKSITTGDPDNGIPYKTKMQPYKIGSILEKHGAGNDIKTAYTHDPIRAGGTNTDYDLVISNHPHDVYGMSTGRGWTSCASMDDLGSASKHMKDEINNHTHIAYLTKRGGNYDTDAIARIAFKHHTAINAKNDTGERAHQTLISEGHVYGQAPTDFQKVAEHEVGKLFPIKNDVYIKNPHVYNDNGNIFHTPEGHDMDAGTLDHIWKLTPDENKKHLYGHVGMEGKYKSKKLRDVQTALKTIMSPPTGDFVSDIERVRNSTHGLDTDQKRGIQYSEKMGYGSAGDSAKRNHIMNIMKTFDPTNADHRMGIQLFNADHPLRYDVLDGMSKSRPVITTAQDFTHANNINKILGNRSNEALNVSENHMLGDDPVLHLGKAGVLKDVDDFVSAYHTFRPKNENYYGLAHRLNSENVPNAHLMLQDATKKLSGSTDLSKAIVYSSMSPSATHYYSHELGDDPEKLIADNKEYIHKFTKK